MGKGAEPDGEPEPSCFDIQRGRPHGGQTKGTRSSDMFGLGAGEILIILVIAFLLFGPKELPEIGRQVGKAVKGFKETTEDLRKTVEPELNLIQQEVKMAQQDIESSIKEAEDEITRASDPDERESERPTTT